MTELLAPAGSIDCAYAAINSGADAIYLGARAFSARASAENFDEDSLVALLRYAKTLDVKVYLAMNTLVKDEELPNFFDTLIRAWNLGIDAVILQDVALGAYIAKTYPQICLHLSTQAGVCSIAGARYAKECGFSRVILARETPFSEIEKITKIIETEVFVQGALCTCFSGQCYFSSFVGGNSGNRGRCKQPCRKKYSFNRDGYEQYAYALSPSDLCVGTEIEKLKAAGVLSFKIEGRMRRAEYVSAATQYYRAILDGKGHLPELFSALKRTYNRGNYTKGLAFGQEKGFLSNQIQGHLGEKVGVVKVENKKYLVDSTFSPVAGDAFKILRKGVEIGGAYFLEKTRRGFAITSSTRLCSGDSVFVTTDTALNERLLDKRKQRKLSLALNFTIGKKAVVSGGGVSLDSDFILESAKSKPLTAEDIKICFLKTDGAPLDVSFEKITIDGEIFLPKSQLNEFRRFFYAKLTQSFLPKRALTGLELPPRQIEKEQNAQKRGVIARDFTCLQGVDVAVYKPDDYDAPLPKTFVEGDFERYLYCPAFCTEKQLLQLLAIVKEYRLDGVYAENFAAIDLSQKQAVKCFVGTGFNITNYLAYEHFSKKDCVSYVALSKELSERERGQFLGQKSMVLVGGDVKLMDLCYCPFEKNCQSCDKKHDYCMKDEQGREFPVHRYSLSGQCRFEVYNSARLVATPKGAGALADYTMTEDVEKALSAWEMEEEQKQLSKSYTYGHAKNGVF